MHVDLRFANQMELIGNKELFLVVINGFTTQAFKEFLVQMECFMIGLMVQLEGITISIF
jgi:hypothetical protein